MKLLEGITILDFSHRLPGPLAGKVLSELGAKVIKIEDKTFGDSFLHGEFSLIDPSFALWYKELNKNKEILQLDFSETDIQSKLRPLLNSADALILGLPYKIKQKLGLTLEQLEAQKIGPLFIGELGAKKNLKKSMHDLNALAEAKVLELHVGQAKNEELPPPPFLPFAGIAFGQQVATDILAGILKAKKEKKNIEHTTFLFETVESNFGAFWSEEIQQLHQKEFLHSGRYPSYNIYRSQDGIFVALACVEKKFWNRFCQVFNLPFNDEDRFDITKRIQGEIEQFFGRMDSKKIKELSESEDLCLSFIKKQF